MDLKIDIPPRDVEAELALAEELTVDPALAQVLFARGLKEAAAARRFLFPDVTSLTPPTDFPDLAKAAELIVTACRKGRPKVFVAGDYDVDGLTATALLTIVFGRLGAAVEYYIPNRLSEGYDLTSETVRRAEEAGARILVTADCGSRAHEAVAAAREAGLTVIVTDHHRLADTLPAAHAVVTPYRLPDGHPARGVAGVGVAYKLAEEIIDRGRLDLDPRSLLPLVALGTVCDVVDLHGENRILAAAGLGAFPGELFPGLAAQMTGAGVQPPVASWHLAFILGPRLNAAGRLGHADYALELLFARDEGRGQAMARKLEDFNAQRRAFEERVAAQALPEAEDGVASGRKALVLTGEGWHPGVIGIVASRIVERFYRPAILIAVEGDAGRGSGRSIPPFDIHEALETLRGHLRRFGGHRLAAGFEIDAGRIPDFAAAFEDLASARLDEEAMRQVVRVDGQLPLGALNVGLAEDLALLEPAGQNNAPARFYTRVSVAEEDQRVFKGAHLEVMATEGPVRVRAIGFNLARGGATLEAGEYGLVHTPRLDRWRDREKIELRLSHITVPEAERTSPEVSVSITDMRRRAGEEPAWECDPEEETVFGFPSQEGLARGGEFIPYFELPSRRRRPRLWLAAPPFDAYRYAALVAGTEEVVFAFGDGEVLRARDFLGSYYPDRRRLTRLYRALREGGSSELEGEGVRRAIRIFEELGFVETRPGKTLAGAAEFRGGDGDPRRPLEESALFRRCERRRQAAEQFIAQLRRWPTLVWETLTAELLTAAYGVDTGAGVL